VAYRNWITGGEIGSIENVEAVSGRHFLASLVGLLAFTNYMAVDKEHGELRYLPM